MNLPKPPYDKSLHMNYGDVITGTTMVLVMISCVLLHLHKHMWWSVPLIGLAVCYVFARGKEISDNRLNAAARDRGEPEPHGYEIADQYYTMLGGLSVAAPVFLALLAAR